MGSCGMFYRDIRSCHCRKPYRVHEAEPGLAGKFRILRELFLFHAEARFKYFVFWDLLRFYWLSSAGWAAVGYTSYPGVPDPHRTYISALHHRSIP